MEDNAHNIKFFTSFEEAADAERVEAAKLTGIECLQHMRQLINLSYSLSNGKMPEPPKHHTITIIKGEYI